MALVTCVKRIKDTNKNIINYVLQDRDGKIINIEPLKLKTLIKNKELSVDNLQLTSDNRLITIDIDKFGFELERYKRFIAKQVLVGTKIFDFIVDTQNQQILISKYYDDPSRQIIKIPGFVTGFYAHTSNTGIVGAFADCCYVQKIICNIKGKADLSGLFREFHGNILDLSEFEVENAVRTTYMFYKARTDSIVITKINMQNVKNTSGMFKNCVTENIELHNFDTSNVAMLNNMFRECASRTINLGDLFSTHSAGGMNYMFYSCLAKTLWLGNKFDISKAYTNEMFDLAVIDNVHVGKDISDKLANIIATGIQHQIIIEE